MSQKLIIGVLVSGRGTNLHKILDGAQSGELNVKVAVVISNREKSEGFLRARSRGVPAVFLDPKKYQSTQEYDVAILETLRKYEVQLVVLAGYMKIVSFVLIAAYRNRMMNIHPSLLPSFPGLHAQRQALEYGVKKAGCTVHFVEEDVDAGPIILQSTVSVEYADTEQTLSARILEQEHIILPRALRLYSEGRIKVVGRCVEIGQI